LADGISSPRTGKGLTLLERAPRIPGHMNQSRKFVDDTGVGWTVREIANPSMPPSLGKLLGADRRVAGWLSFVSEAGERRRLSPYPQDWSAVSDFELNRWCARALKVPPAPARRQQDG
jgi:hypothetical protein